MQWYICGEGIRYTLARATYCSLDCPQIENPDDDPRTFHEAAAGIGHHGGEDDYEGVDAFMRASDIAIALSAASHLTDLSQLAYKASSLVSLHARHPPCHPVHDPLAQMQIPVHRSVLTADMRVATTDTLFRAEQWRVQI